MQLHKRIEKAETRICPPVGDLPLLLIHSHNGRAGEPRDERLAMIIIPGIDSRRPGSTVFREDHETEEDFLNRAKQRKEDLRL